MSTSLVTRVGRPSGDDGVRRSGGRPGVRLAAAVGALVCAAAVTAGCGGDVPVASSSSPSEISPWPSSSPVTSPSLPDTAPPMTELNAKEKALVDEVAKAGVQVDPQRAILAGNFVCTATREKAADDEVRATVLPTIGEGLEPAAAEKAADAVIDAAKRVYCK